jgi:hypothetical protein
MLVDLALGAGVVRNGTMRQSFGRWYDTNLVRFYEGTIRPWGGWQPHSASLAGAGARAILTWIDNSNLRWIAVGTATHLYIYNHAGTQFDITPSGYTPGHVDATVGGGYGNQGYGMLTYGTPRTDTTDILDCTVWTLDTFGQYLVGCNADDGVVYQWKLGTGTPAAALPSTTGTAPVNNRAVMVTGEGFIFVLGAGGNPRLVQWPDQRTDGVWTPSLTVQAGFYQLQTPGRIMCGKRIRGGALIFTDQDVHLATYLGPPLVYGFEQVGTGCGIVSQGAVVITGDNQAVWMARDGTFWTYNGAAAPLPSDIGDWVSKTLNTNQRSKVTAVHNPSFGEVTWFFPQGMENDAYATYNYREGHWSNGYLARTCGIEAGAFLFPLMCDPLGTLWEHETGFSNYSGLAPYAETGPLELAPQGGYSPNAYFPGADGANIMHVLSLIPDTLTLGDVTVTLFGRFYPDEPDTQWGPYPAADPTDLRACARQFRLRYTAASPNDWRIGIPRLDMIKGGER